MKKIFIPIILLLFSCKKEDVKREYGHLSTTPINCNCGIIVHDNGSSTYSIIVSNDCTGNYRTFYLSVSDWFNAFVGNRVCFNDVQSW